MSTNVAAWLWTTAERYSESPAIVTRPQTTTHSTLRARACDFARAFVAAGATPGSRVAILLDRGPEAAAAFFGAAAIGSVAVLMNETLRPRQIEYVLEHSGASVLITCASVSQGLPRVPRTNARVLFAEEVERGQAIQPVQRLDDDLAVLIYTSGSTGMPKGVVVTHGNLHAGTDAVVSYLGLGRDDRIAGVLPFSFDYGFNQLLCAVRTGATLVVERSSVPSTIVDTLAEEHVTVLAAIPPLWLQLLDRGGLAERRLPDLRIMTSTGGNMPVAAVKALRAGQPQARLFLMYGLTEAFRATYLDPDQVDAHPGSIGKAIPGSEILVLREDLSQCGPGETGELVQRGSTVALGYWNDPDETARVFRPNPLRPPGTPAIERVVFSGDLVCRDEEGFLFFVGRRDRMIKTLGYRVSPDEITDVLHASEMVRECAVTTEADGMRGSRIVAHVVLRSGCDLESLIRYSRTEMPRYMQPGRFDVRTELPRTTSGKQDVRVLQESSTP